MWNVRVFPWGVLDGTIRCSQLSGCLVSGGRRAPLEACYFGRFYHKYLHSSLKKHIFYFFKIGNYVAFMGPILWFIVDLLLLTRLQKTSIFPNLKRLKVLDQRYGKEWWLFNMQAAYIPKKIQIPQITSNWEEVTTRNGSHLVLNNSLFPFFYLWFYWYWDNFCTHHHVLHVETDIKQNL